MINRPLKERESYCLEFLVFLEVIKKREKMSAEIWVAVVTSLCTLAGVIITVMVGNSKTLYRIEQLEKKQDKHNTLIERMYRLEDRVTLDEEKIKVANHRIKDLEDGRK